MLTTHHIKAFNDNYFWLIQPEQSSQNTFVVDPGDASKVFDALYSKNLELQAILLTHHHHDHIDGANELAAHFNIPIYGPRSTKIPMVTQFLFEGDRLPLTQNITADIFEIPGHTADHIAYFISEFSPKLFSGDTIFSAGCGRIFDSDSEKLFLSITRIKKLPPATLIYAAHEYTLANLKFAEHIEPNNSQIQIRKNHVQNLRATDQPSLPTLLGDELQFNPFLRTHMQSVQDRVIELTGLAYESETQIFQALRKLKDTFV